MLTAIGMLPSMSRTMVTLLLLCACIASHAASARTLQARIERVTTAVATLEQVQVRLDWPADATQGQLSLTAGKFDAPDLGYHYRDLAWRCPLQRDGGRWRCDGPLRSARGTPVQLAVDLDTATTHATLRRGAATFAVDRRAATPDDTTIDLTRVPLAWTQALLSRAWESGKLKSGTLDGALLVRAPASKPLSVTGTLVVADAAFETPDATIAGESLGGRFAIDYRKTPQRATITVDGSLHGGEFLAGDAYVALPSTPIALHVEASQATGAGWVVPAAPGATAASWSHRAAPRSIPRPHCGRSTCSCTAQTSRRSAHATCPDGSPSPALPT